MIRSIDPRSAWNGTEPLLERPFTRETQEPPPDAKNHAPLRVPHLLWLNFMRVEKLSRYREHWELLV